MIVKDNCLKVCWTFKTRTFENITINYASSLVDTHFLNVNKLSAKESMRNRNYVTCNTIFKILFFRKLNCNMLLFLYKAYPCFTYIKVLWNNSFDYVLFSSSDAVCLSIFSKIVILVSSYRDVANIKEQYAFSGVNSIVPFKTSLRIFCLKYAGKIDIAVHKK